MEDNEDQHWWIVTVSNGKVIREGYMSHYSKYLTIKRIKDFKDSEGIGECVVVSMCYIGFMTRQQLELES